MLNAQLIAALRVACEKRADTVVVGDWAFPRVRLEPILRALSRVEFEWASLDSRRLTLGYSTPIGHGGWVLQGQPMSLDADGAVHVQATTWTKDRFGRSVAKRTWTTPTAAVVSPDGSIEVRGAVEPRRPRRPWGLPDGVELVGA